MSLASQLGRMAREHAADRDGKIHWFPNLWLPALTKRKPVLMGGIKPFHEIADPATGEIFQLFPGRAAKCKNPLKRNDLPARGTANHPYRLVPASTCKSCQFHEPAKRYGRKRYAACVWFRMNNDLPTMAELWGRACDTAARIMGGS